MRVLYLEGDLNGLRLISGTLTRMGVVHDVGRPFGTLPRDLSPFQALIISDFSHGHLLELEPMLVRAISQSGMGLLMLGGKKSFGYGNYSGTELGDLLPVEVFAGDDRVNFPAGVVLQPALSHPVLRGLDWRRPVVVTGYNRVQAKPGTTTVLHGRQLEGAPETVWLSPHRVPLLVVKEAEDLAGRTAAFTTDLAPHWSGGLTGWGARSLAIGDDEEVGEDYATLVMNLVRWVAGEETLGKPIPDLRETRDLPTLEPSLPMRAGDKES